MQGASVWYMLASNRVLPRGSPRRSVLTFPFYRWENGAPRVVVMGPGLSVLVPRRQAEMVSFLSLVMWDNHISEASSRGLWDPIQPPALPSPGTIPMQAVEEGGECERGGIGSCTGHPALGPAGGAHGGGDRQERPCMVLASQLWGTQTWTHVWALPLRARRPSLF